MSRFLGYGDEPTFRFPR